MYITALVFSSPRLAFSSTQESLILTFARELGAQGVPTAYALKQERQQIKTLLGDPTSRLVAVTGDVYYLNDIASALAKVGPNASTSLIQ